MSELLLDAGGMKDFCVLVFAAGSIFSLILNVSRSRRLLRSPILQVDANHDTELSKDCMTYCAYLIRYLESLPQYHHLSPANSELLHDNITLLGKIVKNGYSSVQFFDEKHTVERKEGQSSETRKGDERERNVEAEFRDLMLRVTLNPFERLPLRVDSI